MELAARRFARWVLIIHLLALLVIGVLVVLAAREVYHSSREQAIDQARRRQELLATQTARGIDSFYRAILDNLHLERHVAAAGSNPDVRLPPPNGLTPEMRQIIGTLMWGQLRDRATHLFGIERPAMRVVQQYTDISSVTPEHVIALAGEWLKAVRQPQISDTYTLGGALVNLVAVPMPGPADRLIVAVVPLARVQKLFLSDVNNMRLMSGWLVDADGDVMLSFDPRLVGLNLDRAAPEIRALKQKFDEGAAVGTQVIERPVQLGPVTLVSAMVTVHPIDLPGNRWLLGIASGLDEVDAVVQRVFRRAFRWAVFVIVSLTALLTSTSIFMIRARLRLERVRRDLLTRELDQAREIQLAWLPDGRNRGRRTDVALDIAAVNEPASHISGDFYNWFELGDGRTVVLIGDVTGHGMAAAFLMATTQLLVRMTMTSSGDAGKCLDEVNRQLCVQGFSGQFVTMLLMVIEPDGQTIEIASAGHPPPLMCRGETIESMEIEPQLVLGVECDVPYESRRMRLPGGVGLLLYTDGVTDAISTNNERFGLTRLLRSVVGVCDDAQALLSAVRVAVEKFRLGRPLADDLTLVAIQLQHAEVGKSSGALGNSAVV